MHQFVTRLCASAIFSFLVTAVAYASDKSETNGAVAPSPLYEQISELDRQVFESFNNCSDTAQLVKHESYFTPNVEFYHDTGGVTWTRDEMIANTKKFACGNFRRVLVPNTLSVYPIKGYGAIEEGAHRFCQVDTGKCEGIADFVMIWHNQDNQWLITRVLSYGHRSNK